MIIYIQVMRSFLLALTFIIASSLPTLAKDPIRTIEGIAIKASDGDSIQGDRVDQGRAELSGTVAQRYQESIKADYAATSHRGNIGLRRVKSKLLGALNVGIWQLQVVEDNRGTGKGEQFGKIQPDSDEEVTLPSV